jgi:thiol:disulfide interchange protein DsbD
MKSSKTALLIAVALFSAHFIKAQMIEPVSWTFKSESLNDGEYKIFAIAAIEEGWYVYSQDLNTNTPIPTRLQFDNNQNIVLEGKPLEIGTKNEAYDANFNTTLKRLTGRTIYVQKVKVAGNTLVLKGSLQYMTCNGQMCMPPQKVEFSLALKP